MPADNRREIAAMDLQNLNLMTQGARVIKKTGLLQRNFSMMFNIQKFSGYKTRVRTRVFSYTVLKRNHRNDVSVVLLTLATTADLFTIVDFI